MVDIAALKSELTLDPESLGYASHVSGGSGTEIAKLINQPDSARQFDNLVTAFDMEEAVDPADWPTPGNEQWKRDLWRDILLSIGATGAINANATNLKGKVQLIFGAGTPTRSNLTALQTRDGSRAEELFGENVTFVQIGQALAL